jgi:hypothetical protein
MMMRSCAITAGRRRGGILFEVVLAVALFGGAAAFTLASVRSVFTTLDQTRRQQELVDLARSKLAQLEAGLITLADLRGGQSAIDGSPEVGRALGILDLKTSRTEFTGLTLVELTVGENIGGPTSENSNAMSYTLRQLMSLRANKAQPFEQGLGDE